MSVAKQLKIMDSYKSYKAIPPAKQAWITIKSKKAGKNPDKVRDGIKAAFTKRRNQKQMEKFVRLLIGF
jgi:hypothetical protein